MTGQKRTVNFTGVDTLPESAYIEIVPSGVVHGSEEDIDNHISHIPEDFLQYPLF
ncbi:MAG: hypothetical protein GY718_12835 [Lentisphaerae bacterium]|nr:hypothetical protein [Lentisphaerota bacterium]